ncbi:MAG: tetratricopeptide repeat protein, partial [Anaerolineales bacterium]|nr:tetratricopeptide repeat protein [Anaerolineales bacterium]
SISEEDFSLLHERTAGRPLYIALAYDWLVNGVGSLDELLGFSESFAAELVGWVRRLEPVKKMAILYMAFAWRRMEISLLSDMLGISAHETQKLVDELMQFSFIKYRPIEDEHFVVNLHDEMRMLVNEYVWSKEVSVEQEKPYAATLNWYAKTLKNPDLFNGKDNPKNDRERALLAEDLYYRLRMNLAEGLRHYESRFRSAVHYLDLAYCNMLNQEVGEVRRQLSQAERDQHDFRTALTAFRMENYPKAGGIWHAFVNRPDVDPLQRATTLMLLVEMDSYTGNPKEAAQHAKEAERAYLSLLKKAANARERSALKQQLGELYNNWGFACRVRDDYKQALLYYQKALKVTGGDAQAKKHKARVLNNMGYVYYLLGDTERARTYVGRALHIRQDLEIPYELGLGYNTFGEIMEDGGRLRIAMDLYAKAYQAFDEIHSNRGKAMAQINLGKLKRFMNEYDASLKELFAAEQSLRRLRDRDNLLKALNEIGSTYRQKGDWQNALKYFDDALELSVKLGKKIQQADTYDDIAVTYYKMALLAIGKEQREYLKKAEFNAIKSQKLAQSESVDFFIAKADLALGDISYLEGEYDTAFKHYFEATSRMAKAWASRNKASGFYQRRYEESLDRMQERLHGFERKEGIKKTLLYVKRIIAKIDRLPAKEKRAFVKARRTLKATLETTKLAK